LASYYQAYAKHFGLLERIVFGVSVTSIKRSPDTSGWLLTLEDEEKPRPFDKVILATGSEVVPRMPDIEGLEDFQGRFLHGQVYKRYDAS
jgi:dimethylaniline monooxygenase (N-oxide forming)